MNAEPSITRRKHDQGSVATTKLLLIGSAMLLVVAAMALAFLWYNASSKDAKLEREKEDIKLERQLAKDSDKEQSVIVVHVPENLPMIDAEPVVPQQDKPAPKPQRDQVSVESNQPQTQNEKSSEKSQYNGWKKYLALSTEDYSLSYLLAKLENSLLP